MIRTAIAAVAALAALTLAGCSSAPADPFEQEVHAAADRYGVTWTPEVSAAADDIANATCSALDAGSTLEEIQEAADSDDPTTLRMIRAAISAAVEHRCS